VRQRDLSAAASLTPLDDGPGATVGQHRGDRRAREASLASRTASKSSFNLNSSRAVHALHQHRDAERMRR
jgi:hypothetical protein